MDAQVNLNKMYNESLINIIKQNFMLNCDSTDAGNKLFGFWLYIMNFDVSIEFNKIKNDMLYENVFKILSELKITCKECHALLNKYDYCEDCNLCYDCCNCED